MGIILIFLIIAGNMGFITYVSTEKEEYKTTNAITAFVVSSIIFSIFLILSGLISYDSYIDMKQDLAVIEQYSNSIKYYKEQNISQFKNLNSKEITDLKYNKYQEQLSKMIIDLRNRIIGYNEIYAAKKVKKDSFLFNILIILPSDMKPVKMEKYIN
jgi:hypothetical protein